MKQLKRLLPSQAPFGQSLPALAGGFLPAYILAFLLGVVLYFKLPIEPSLGHILLLSTVFVVTGVVGYIKHTYGWYILLISLWLAAVGVGLGYATWHTSTVQTQFWSESQARTVWVTGDIEKLNTKTTGFTTVTLKNVVTMNGESVKHWQKIIISAHTSRFKGAAMGTKVAAQARLWPPAKPLHPSMYDWQMRSYFEGVGATGLIMGDLYLTEPETPLLLNSINTFRHRLFERLAATQHSGAGVGAALLTGLRGGIPLGINEDYRRSGLAHLMAISGMHLGMVSAAVYFVLLFVLVRLGQLPYKVDVRKLAALGALMAAAGYTLMAGATVPTLRAFCLILAAFFALLSGRIHLGVRVLALVALGLAVYQPYLMLTASFQLSFVAALALVVWAYVRQTQRVDLGTLTPKTNAFWQSIQVSIVATLATTPFIALHFKQVALVAVVANVIAIPLLAFAILPLGFSAIILGHGGGEWLLAAYLYMVNILNQVAHFMAELPMASLAINPQAVPFLWVVTVSLLLAFLFKRWALVLVAVVAAFPLVAAQKMVGPAVIVLEGGRNIIATNGINYIPITQTEHLSDKAFEALIRVLPNPQKIATICNNSTCHYGSKNGGLLVAADSAELSEEDCFLNKWIITPQNAHFTCIKGATVYSPESATGFYITKQGLKIEGYPSRQGQRPWTQ